MRTNVVIGLKPGLANQALLDLARDVAAKDATLHIVSFVTVGRDDDEAERLASVTADIEALGTSLRGQGYAVETVVQINAIGLGNELTEYAERVGADLIVIGLAKRTRVGKALVGGDAQTVLLNATCPVLATRIS
jgi:nucleotide-binding universal stress UspA family protein